MTAAPGHTRDAGVSLIEVLAALAIVALMGAVAVVMLDARRSALDRSADRLTRAMGEARETALTTGRMIGFSTDADFRGWRFHDYRQGRWVVIEDHPAFEPVRLPDGLMLEVRDGAIAPRQEAAERNAPQVWFDPAGFDAPFTYALADDEETRLIARLDDGRLRMGAPDELALAERRR